MGKSIFVSLVIFLSLITVVTLPLYSQFSYDKLEDYSVLEFGKPMEFYSYPRYNRVEGLFLNFGIRYHPPSISKVQIYGDVGWGFQNQSDKQFRYTGGIRKDFFEIKRLSLGVEIFKKVESEDDWIIGGFENSLAAFFLREDFKDYYGTQGFKIYFDHRFLGTHTLRLELSRITYDVLRKNTNWSVFGGSKNFENNPAREEISIAEGDEVGLRLITVFDWRDNSWYPLNGWYLEGIYEHTSEDFNTDGLFLIIKRYQQTFGNQRLLIRVMFGTRHGSLAEQYIMDLGGIGSLRGFNDKEFTGNRMVMINANYFFERDIFQKIPLGSIPLLGGLWSVLSFGIFVDTGWAWMTDPSDGLFDGFGQLALDKLKTDVGFSILALDGVIRIDVAKRTERSNDDFRITFRLLEKF